MPRKLNNALTSLSVKNAKAGRHADGAGLHLLVKESGARSWVYRFMLKGKSRDVGLGAAGADGISLADARHLATLLRLKVKAGIDPLEEREEKAAATLAAAQAAKVAGITFRTVAEMYIGANEASWRNDKHRQQWRNTLASYVYPVIGELPVADVGTDHVLEILEPIWEKKPETASRVRGRIETILDAAKARKYRVGENPARMRGHISQLLPARSLLTRGHHKAMAYTDIPALISDLRQKAAMAARALEFVILTGTRTSKVLGATWSEIDLGNATWTIPASRMKAHKVHRVPLSPRAVELLMSLKSLGHEFVFPADKGGRLSTMAMSMLLRRMKLDCTVHGFRSSFRDWAAERTDFAHELCEMALAHAISNKSEAAYRRGDMLERRRPLMIDWASHCDNVLTPAT